MLSFLCFGSDDACLGRCSKVQDINTSNALRPEKKRNEPKLSESKVSKPVHDADAINNDELCDAEPINEQQSSFLSTNAPEPTALDQQRSTHHDEELGLSTYVSTHHFKGRPSSPKLMNDGVSPSRTSITGYESEVIINLSTPDVSISVSADHEYIPNNNIWQSNMSSQDVEPDWNHRTPLCSSNMISVNNDLIVADDDTGIYKYDIHNNEWNVYIPYSTETSVLDPSICYDKTRNIIYLFGENDDCEGIIAYVDMGIKQIDIIADHIQYMGNFPVLWMIGNSLHLITGTYDIDIYNEESVIDLQQNTIAIMESQTVEYGEFQKHFVWNFEKRKFKLIFKFPQGVLGQSVIYIKSKKVVLFLEHNGMWMYQDMHNKWRKIKDVRLPSDMNASAGALSRCDNFYILFGCGEKRDKMYIFDIRDLNEITYFESSVISVQFGENYKCLMDDNVLDEMLICGYLREVHAHLLDDDIRKEVMVMVERFYIEQYIHIISDVNSHFKALVSDVLQCS